MRIEVLRRLRAGLEQRILVNTKQIFRRLIDIFVLVAVKLIQYRPKCARAAPELSLVKVFPRSPLQTELASG